MGQVIGVRVINPLTKEVLIDEVTLTSVPFNKTDHKPAHRQAIELALYEGSGGAGVLKDLHRVGDPIAGANWSWLYKYEISLADDEYDREAWAFLFTQYKESEKES